jgi:glycosyl transferase family 25
MRLGHVSEHLRAYWGSLRGRRQQVSEAHQLGEVLRCPVFVINLERSPHRRAYMINYLAGHGLQARIFPAVDGSRLDLGQLQQQGIYDDGLAHQRFSRSLSRAEVACTLSHLNIHRTMIDEGIPRAMVLEDDAMFAPEIVRRLRGALSEAPVDWELLQLSHNCDEYERLADNLVRFPSNTRMAIGSAGYLIRRSGAEKMLAHGLPICYPADSLMGRSPRWGVALFGLAPSAVVQNAIFPTQIYERSSWSIKVTQFVKQALVSIFGGLARAFGGSK